MNGLYIALGWLLHTMLQTTYATMIWTTVLGVTLFCTTRLCRFFNYQGCPAEALGLKRKASDEKKVTQSSGDKKCE